MTSPSFATRLGLRGPTGAWAWPHSQRLAERWLRRWGYALTGLAVGGCAMCLARPEVGESHAAAEQAVAHWRQQLAVQTPSPAAPTPSAQAAVLTDARARWERLPVWAPAELLWADWQQAMAAQGLRLQELQTRPPGPVALAPQPVTGADVNPDERQASGLVSHVAAMRVLGRFDDWAHLWAACAQTVRACALERITVVPTEQPPDVQIDVVMRVWMRADIGDTREASKGDALSALVTASGGEGLALALMNAMPGERWHEALFVPARGPALAALPEHGPHRFSEPISADPMHEEVLSEDPSQWPWSQVRLLGLWRQGSDHQAVLAAGQNWVRVQPGQRVSLEGYRVVDITDQGVRLRQAHGPVVQLTLAEKASGVPRAVHPPAVHPPVPTRTNERSLP